MDERVLRAADARAGVLGTTGRDGRPHLIPVTFALTRDHLVTAVDWKPKSGRKLQRIANLERDPRATLLIHHYSDVWEDLWWVRVDAIARIHESGVARDEAIAALAAKYPQYRERPPGGAVIAMRPENVVSWAASS